MNTIRVCLDMREFLCYEVVWGQRSRTREAKAVPTPCSARGSLLLAGQESLKDSQDQFMFTPRATLDFPFSRGRTEDPNPLEGS